MIDDRTAIEPRRTPGTAIPGLRRDTHSGAHIRRALRMITLIVLLPASLAATFWLLGWTIWQIAGRADPLWLFGRAAGITSYVL